VSDIESSNGKQRFPILMEPRRRRHGFAAILGDGRAMGGDMRGYVLGFLAAILGMGPAMALPLGDTAVPYDAERIVVTGGKTYTGKIFAIPGRQRHEQVWNGLHLVAILRGDRKLAWVILQDLHVYAELPFPDAITDYADPHLLGAPIGHEDMAGIKVDEYRLEHDGEDGSGLDGWLWMSKDGIVVKIDGHYHSPVTRPISATYHLEKLHLGPQAATLFELPKGLARLPPEAIEPLLELRGRR